METEPIISKPMMDGIQAAKDRPAPPGNSCEGPPGTDVGQVSEVGGGGIHPGAQAIATEHHRVCDGVTHRRSFRGEPAQIGLEGLEIVAHLARIVATQRVIETGDEHLSDTLQPPARRSVAGMEPPQVK